MKSLKQLWNEKKLALKNGHLKQALALNKDINKRIQEELQ